MYSTHYGVEIQYATFCFTVQCIWECKELCHSSSNMSNITTVHAFFVHCTSSVPMNVDPCSLLHNYHAIHIPKSCVALASRISQSSFVWITSRIYNRPPCHMLPSPVIIHRIQYQSSCVVVELLRNHQLRKAYVCGFTRARYQTPDGCHRRNDKLVKMDVFDDGVVVWLWAGVLRIPGMFYTNEFVPWIC